MHSWNSFYSLYIKWIYVIQEIGIAQFLFVSVDREKHSRLILPDRPTILFHEEHEMITC